MSRRNGGEAESPWGQVELVPENAGQQEEIRSPVSGAPPTGVTYHWVPPADWAGELPPDFDFSLRCVTVGSGRRFYPIEVGSYLAMAFAGGLAVLTRAMNLSAEQVFSYRAGWLLFQRIRATREHLRNRLNHPASLRIRRSARGLAEVNSILPEWVGQDGGGRGKPWSLDRLLDEGRKEARRQGVARPDGSDCVRYGLLLAARRNPLRITDPDEVTGLVRLSLYEVPDTPAPDPQTRDEVVARVLDALKPHLAEGEGADEFARWFMGPNNSLIGQVGRKKRSPGGALEPSVVRHALSDQGWVAYGHVADCVHTMLYLFRKLLPEALSAAEGRLFGRMHLKQPEFGGLPWFLLAERFAQLETVIDRVWEEPDNRETVAVMHRLLALHADMAAARRQADRLATGRKAGARRKGQVLLDVELPDELLLAPLSESTEVLEDLADRAASDMGLSCGCKNPTWGLRPDDLDEGSAVIYCSACDKGGRQVPLSLLCRLAQAGR
jgi:hypothetical protein